MAIREISYQNETFKISYELLAPKAEPLATVLFLHGWGSSKDAMKMAFKAVLKDCALVFVDLPGFGKSSAPKPLKTSDYAEILRAFLSDVELTPNAIVGHSFGGKVATLLSPDLLVLLSSAGIPTKKPFKVKCKIAFFKFLKCFGLGFLYKKFASKDAAKLNKTMYKTFKNVVNEDFTEIFAKFDKPTLIFWGDKDRATPPSSGEKLHALVKNSKFHMLDGDHFFFLKHTRFLGEQILLALRETKTSESICETACEK